MTIAYDPVQKRPGCAILQAILGGSPGIANHFSSETWLVHQTPDMTTYSVTPDQLTQLVTITERAWRSRL